MKQLNTQQLIKRSLKHHWRLHIAVGFGVAVALSILTGSLIVGDSVKATLKTIANDKIGNFEYVIAGERFFTRDIASTLWNSEQYPEGFQEPIACLMVDGSVAVENEGQKGALAGEVTVVGTDSTFFSRGFPDYDFGSMEIASNKAWINQSLADELGVSKGGSLYLELRSIEDAPLKSFLGNDPEGGASVRLEVERIIENRGPGLFSLKLDQSSPRLVYLNRELLAEKIEQKERANVLLVPTTLGTIHSSSLGKLEEVFSQSLKLVDYGLTLRKLEDFHFLSLESRRMVLEPEVQKVVEAYADKESYKREGALTHLAKLISIKKKESEAPPIRSPRNRRQGIPYSMVTALKIGGETEFSPFKVDLSSRIEDEDKRPLQDDEILINTWAAEDLKIQFDPKAPIEIEVEYFIPESQGKVETGKATFKLAGIVNMEGMGANSFFTPEYPGLTSKEVQSLKDWDPPFEFENSLIKKQDETYWEKYRGTPKAFITSEVGKKLFQGSHGEFTTLHLDPPAGISLDQAQTNLETHLVSNLELRNELGFSWKNLREEGQKFANASTDFGMLFISFSFFLIIAASILIALLFTLQMERRSKEAGLLLALGQPVSMVRKFFVREGLVVAFLGGIIGILGAWIYGKFLIIALSTWWWEAVRVPYFVFSMNPVSVAIGFVSTLLIVWVAIFLASKSFKRLTVRGLLAGVTQPSRAVEKVTAKKSQWLFWISTVSAIALAFLGGQGQVGMFFGVGALALIAGLSQLSIQLRRERLQKTKWSQPTLFKIGRTNSARTPTRSLLTAGIVASAAFVLVSVAAHQHDANEDPLKLESGNGGFPILATSVSPLPGSFGDPKVREGLEIDDFFLDLPDGSQKEIDWSGLQAYPFRLKPGDNTSCLNLYTPQNPRVLGASQSFIDRGGFTFKGVLSETEEEKQQPWTLLNKTLPDGVIPAIGDWNSTTWILKKGLGDTIEVDDGKGGKVKLQLVATLAGSLFQSELIISEAHFEKAFRHIEGYRYFLADFQSEVSSDIQSNVQLGLELGLESYGLDVTSPNRLIASFLAIENTYLSTFQLLGGLGLILGTLGLGIVLIRGVLERQGEFGLMAAVGFSKKRLSWLVIYENLFLLVSGLAIGSISALIAIAPKIFDPASNIPWGNIVILLIVVFVVGLLSGLFAVGVLRRLSVVGSLRQE